MIAGSSDCSTCLPAGRLLTTMGQLSDKVKTYGKRKMKNAKFSYEKDLQNILAALLRYKPEKVILFGSAARGEIQKGSDLDFFLIKNTRKRFTQRIKEVYQKYLAKADYSLPTDVVVYTPREAEMAKKENRLFFDKISKEGRILYEAA